MAALVGMVAVPPLIAGVSPHEMTIELLTAALVAITAFYACVTIRIMRANERTVSAMRQQTEALVRPYVTVAVMTVPGSPVFCLRIANTGRTGAEDVRLTMDRDFFQYGQKTGRNLRTMAPFSNRSTSLLLVLRSSSAWLRPSSFSDRMRIPR